MEINKYKIRNVIEKYGIKPKKRLGQNFIFDRNILDKIVNDIPKHYDSSAKLITIDGVRLETENFWFLLRASNTQNCIVFRLEHFVNDKFKEELIKLISILESYPLDIKELTSFNQTI